MYYAANTDSAQQIAKAVYDREPAATAAVTALLNSYDDAASTVHHPKMRAALNAFRDANQKSHLQLPREIQRLGVNTAAGAKTVADAQNDSSNVQQQSCASGDNLNRQQATPIRP